MRVVTIYHGGRDATHRERERALTRAGVEVCLVVPSSWPRGTERSIEEPFEVVEMPMVRLGDINRHRFADPTAVSSLIGRFRPDVVDFHEEPCSSVVHQILYRLPVEQKVVTYTAQNIDKRFPPPFAQWERYAFRRVQGIYPCTRQAASVVVGKGFTGAVRVLPLPPPPDITRGDQRPPSAEIKMLLVGRMVAAKGVLDAVRLLAEVRRHCPATLILVGSGPEMDPARRLAHELNISAYVDSRPWVGPVELARHYRDAHIVLAPSLSTRAWVEQFGRMVTEAQAAGAVVVGYASGSLPEVVGAAGVLVPEGDVAALMRAVLELRDRPDRWVELRAAGFALAGGRTWDGVAAGQHELYAEAQNTTPAQHRRVSAQRDSAVLRFGEPAQIAGGGRPFALPLLRESNAATRILARGLDLRFTKTVQPKPQKIKVVYIDHVARLSGGELALARLIAALPDVQAHVILGEEGPLRQALLNVGATVEVLPLNPNVRDTRRSQIASGGDGIRSILHSMEYALRLARRLRALNPDVVHTNSLKSGFYGSLAARLSGRPVIWHLRDRIAADYLPERVAKLTRLAVQHLPDFVVANSDETLRTTGLGSQRRVNRRRRFRRPTNWRVIGGVINVPAGAAEPERVRGEHILIGMVGRLAPWKGQDIFLQAFSAAFKDAPEVRARIIGSAMFGEDDYARSLHALTRDLDLQDRVTFSGFSDQVGDELRYLDVLVHASVVAEPFGQVVLEGMAAGLPVVASAAGGPAEIITDEVDGLLTEPGNIDHLAVAIRRLVAEPELRRKLASSAIIRARDFGPDLIGKAWQQLYQEMAYNAKTGRDSLPAIDRQVSHGVRGKIKCILSNRTSAE